MTTMLKWLGEHSFLGKLLNGNGKEEKLCRVEQQAKAAHARQCEVLEDAGLKTARLTQHSVELLYEDDSRVDILAISIEVEAELEEEEEEALDATPLLEPAA